MKRYLWTAVAVLFVNANASENPFALKENLLKIDNDQEMLLSELSKLAEAREDAELDAEDDLDIEETKEEVSDEAPQKKEDAEEEYNLVNAIDALVGVTEDEAMSSIENTAVEKAKSDTKVKAVQDTSDKEMAEQKKAQKDADLEAKLAEDAREEERREVAAYEKQRAEKLARQAKAEEKSSVKIVDIDVEAEKRAAKESADTGYMDAVKEMGGEDKIAVEEIEMEEETPVEKLAVTEGEIDVEAEKKAAAEAVDTAYLEAIREMDQGD